MLGQNFNSAGIRLFVDITMGNQQLAIPHLAVPNINHIKWEALKEAGFKGCVLDKDNTLTNPFMKTVNPAVQASLESCKKALPTVLFSNSAGLAQYDPDGKEATELQETLGVPVLRHTEKKPGGGVAELEAHFGCSANQLVMVGDRYLTDIVFGNRNKMLTIYVQPFDATVEPLGVRLARNVEDSMVARWQKKGIQSSAHDLIQGAESTKFVLEPTDNVTKSQHSCNEL